MGLDMYLNGFKHYRNSRTNNQLIDGFPLKEEKFELGYWRKHPDLHGYIVKKFAGGNDDCQMIELSIENLEQILEAVKAKKLPKTKGFFFGESGPEDDPPTIKILKQAIRWLKLKNGTGEFVRGITYQASW